MSDVNVAGENLVSTTRASELTGYSKDYIGQLCRGEKISCRRISGQWYVDLETLTTYKKGEAQKGVTKEKPYKDKKLADSVTSMKVGNVRDDTFTYDGVEYVSTGRAAELTGYAQDYVGQLARNTEVAARKVGRRWFVSKAALLQHKKHNDAQLAAVQAESVGLTNSKKDESEKNEEASPVTITKSEEPRKRPHLNFNVRYVTETQEALPIVRESHTEGEETIRQVDPSGIEDVESILEEEKPDEPKHTLDVLSEPTFNKTRTLQQRSSRKDDIVLTRRPVVSNAHHTPMVATKGRKPSVLRIVLLSTILILAAGAAGWFGYQISTGELHLEDIFTSISFLQERYGELIPGKQFDYTQ